jgi:hypothetical protein
VHTVQLDPTTTPSATSPYRDTPAVGRLDADRSRDCGGLANRTTGVGAHRQRRFESRERSRGSTSRSAGNPIKIPWVAGGSIGTVFGGRTHGELIHVGLAEDYYIGSTQTLDHR